jgi:hypothetical protein
MKTFGLCPVCAEAEFPAYTVTTDDGFHVRRDVREVMQFVAEMEEGTQVKISLRKRLGRHLIDLLPATKPLGPTTEDRLARLEALQGLSPAPKPWGITAARIQRVRELRGASLEGARQLLIKNFGQALPEEEE